MVSYSLFSSFYVTLYKKKNVSAQTATTNAYNTLLPVEGKRVSTLCEEWRSVVFSAVKIDLQIIVNGGKRLKI